MKRVLRSSLFRRSVVVLVHMAIWAAALGVAFLIRFDQARVPEPFRTAWPYALLALLTSRVAAFYLSSLFHSPWRYAGLPELARIITSTSYGTIAFVVAGRMIGPAHVPRSIYVLEWLAAIAMVGGLRFALRMWYERRQGRRHPDAIATLIVGAGHSGESLLRDLQRMPNRKWEVIGFLDDDPILHSALMRDVRVLGPPDEETLRRVVKEQDVKLVVLAMPHADGRRTREIVNVCRRLGVQAKTVPGVANRIQGLGFSNIREIAIEDLLRRDPIRLDVEQVEAFLEGRTVLITGAAGSIGSELCRQVLRFRPARLLLVDHNENGLFYIERELRQLSSKASLVPLLCDITDRDRVEWVFRRYRPSVVFHAAAHKHVSMMEGNSPAAVKNNVFGTMTVADAAHAHSADTFVMISTDKAVNPTSVMGATKRAAEMAIQARAQTSSTRYVAVRFGNVLGSAGSVVPLFKEQIAKGQAITVTHPDVRRYFMTIPEATQLVLQTGALGSHTDIFILDMGEPVKIVDLARDMIELSGLRPDIDIKIEFVGLRPGEKLFEELLLDGEASDATPHPKIRVGRIQPAPRDLLSRSLTSLRAASEAGDDASIRRILSELIPEATLTLPEERISALPEERTSGLPGLRLPMPGSA